MGIQNTAKIVALKSTSQCELVFGDKREAPYSNCKLFHKKKQRGCPLLGANKYTYIYIKYIYVFILFIYYLYFATRNHLKILILLNIYI